MVKHRYLVFLQLLLINLYINSELAAANHTLTIHSVPYGEGTVKLEPALDEYSPGSRVTITAVPGPGYIFSHFSGTVSSTNSIINITMDGDKEVILTFKEPMPQKGRIRRVLSMENLPLTVKRADMGDTIRVASHTFRGDGSLLEIKDVHGSAEAPIRILARHKGRVKLKGRCGIIISDCSYLVLEGFSFQNDNINEAILLQDSHNIRITRNHFALKEVSTEKCHWLRITGGRSHHNRIDHNLFENKSNLGVFLCTQGRSGNPPLLSTYDRIDHNIFSNIGPRMKNGLEAVRLGNSHLSMASAYTTLEYNYFYDCNGDPEVISVKVSDAVIQHNTFRDCQGSLVLRHGNRCLANGNFFIRSDSLPKEVGGIRFYGDDQVIINNYFYNLNGRGDEGPLVLVNGEIDTPKRIFSLDRNEYKKRFRPHNAYIANNTWLNCSPYTIEVGWNAGGKLKLPALDAVFSDNIISCTNGHVIKFTDSHKTMQWKNNIIHMSGDASFCSNAFTVKGSINKNPGLHYHKGMMRPGKSSIAVDSAKTIRPEHVKHDIDRQERDSRPDIGADEYLPGLPGLYPMTDKEAGPDAP